MVEMSIGQQFLFLLYLGVFGLAVGIILDFFKAWMKVFNFSRKTVFFMDFLFCLLFAFLLFHLLLIINRGEVRLYTFLALLTGIILYYNFGSPFLHNCFLRFFRTTKKIIERITKTVLSWQDLLNKKRTIYKDRYNRWKSSFRKEE
jgi:spore cortex biosynthesis protein YabQ